MNSLVRVLRTLLTSRTPRTAGTGATGAGRSARAVAWLPGVALAAALIALTAACGTSSSSPSPGTTSPASSTATPTAAATAPSYSISVSIGPAASLTQASPTASPVTAPATAAASRVYLAEGGSVTGTVVAEPGCADGCPLSGDGTTSLWNMTWPTWNSVQAVGDGTEKIDDCDPDCATGTLHAVKVTVLLSKPVQVCVSGAGRLFWTQVTFTWPNGLPSVLSGDNAPTNPFTYPEITSQASTSCP
jgi:hypothetical protein